MSHLIHTAFGAPEWFQILAFVDKHGELTIPFTDLKKANSVRTSFYKTRTKWRKKTIDQLTDGWMTDFYNLNAQDFTITLVTEPPALIIRRGSPIVDVLRMTLAECYARDPGFDPFKMRG